MAITAKAFFASAFFWSLFGWVLVVMIDNSVQKFMGKDLLDAGLKMIFPDGEGASKAGLRGQILGGITFVSALGFFAASVGLQSLVKTS